MWNKFLLVFIAVFLYSTCLIAQKDSTLFKSNIYIGLQYGMSWNDVQFSSPQVAQKILQGQRLSFVLRYVSDPHLGIQLELGYDQRGWIEKKDGLTSNYSRSIDYAELAFFTHISIGKGFIQPVILLGSYFSYPINEKEIYPSEWATDPSFYYGKPLPERLQFGLAGGLGFEFCPKNTLISLLIDGRYRSSLAGIFSSEESFTFSNSRGFMSQVSGLYRF